MYCRRRLAEPWASFWPRQSSPSCLDHHLRPYRREISPAGRRKTQVGKPMRLVHNCSRNQRILRSWPANVLYSWLEPCSFAHLCQLRLRAPPRTVYAVATPGPRRVVRRPRPQRPRDRPPLRHKPLGIWGLAKGEPRARWASHRNCKERWESVVNSRDILAVPTSLRTVIAGG